MSGPSFHFLGWGGSQPPNHVELVARYKPGMIKVPASPSAKTVLKSTQAGLSKLGFPSSIT